MKEELLFETQEQKNIYIALKLLEELYLEKQISQTCFKNILQDYKTIIPTNKLFNIWEKGEKYYGKRYISLHMENKTIYYKVFHFIFSNEYLKTNLNARGERLWWNLGMVMA